MEGGDAVDPTDAWLNVAQCMLQRSYLQSAVIACSDLTVRWASCSSFILINTCRNSPSPVCLLLWTVLILFLVHCFLIRIFTRLIERDSTVVSFVCWHLDFCEKSPHQMCHICTWKMCKRLLCTSGPSAEFVVQMLPFKFRLIIKSNRLIHLIFTCNNDIKKEKKKIVLSAEQIFVLA